MFPIGWTKIETFYFDFFSFAHFGLNLTENEASDRFETMPHNKLSTTN